jgi:3',5'-cyclic AMP phosphodiesterase CpdA
MPISLPPLSRRQFLGGSAAVAASWLVAGSAAADQPQVDPNRFALFADTHIAGDPQTVSRNVNMTDNFTVASREVLEANPLPNSVLVGGDCAYLSGTAEDYRQLHGLAKPVREGGVAMHFAMGNHDHRQRFWDIVEEGHQNPPPVQQRHLTVLRSPHANWFLLDSLDETNKTPGVLGEAQLAWLARRLDGNDDKPALVMVHHNPDESPKPSGLVETRQLLDLLAARPHVKALFFGHSHHWALGKEKHVHLVNLPPVAYLFREGDPSGWVDALIRPDGVSLTMRCIDKQHALSDKQFDLRWSAS